MSTKNSQSESSPLVVKYIFAYPKTTRYVQYLVNESTELHSHRKEDMYKFLVDLVPSRAKEIKHLLSIFHSFILYVEEEKIEELVFDYRGHAEQLRQSVRQFNANTAALTFQKHRNAGRDTIAEIAKNGTFLQDVIEYYRTQVEKAEESKGEMNKKVSDSDKTFLGKIITQN